MPTPIVLQLLLMVLGLDAPGDSLPPVSPFIPRPQAPYVEKDCCPFECCQFGRWVAESPLVAYREEGDTSRIAFHLVPGDTVAALGGNVHMERLGEVLVTDSFAEFERGDTLLLLGYAGEGSIPVWHEGTVRYVEKFWWIPPESTAPDDSSERLDDSMDSLAVMISAPVMDWWVLVRRGESVGWLRLRNRTNLGFWCEERINGMDACR